MTTISTPISIPTSTAIKTATATTPILDIQNLSIAFRQNDQDRRVVDQLSLQIETGETLALVGESGSGKSVTALSILRLLPTPPTVYPSGDILFNGESLLHADDKILRHHRGNSISMIFQEPMVSLNPLHQIEKQLSEVLLIHRGMGKQAARSEILEVLQRVRLRDAKTRLNAYPHQLSGGERQRVMIAMAILTKPKLLIADEPTTALDVTVQAQILLLLKELKQEMNMSLLFITHDLNIVRKLADNVAVMRQDKCVEQNTREQLFNHPQHKYTQELLDSEPKGQPLPVAENSPTLLEIKHLTIGFPRLAGFLKPKIENRVVNNISFTIRKGESLGLVGESGSGKSTTGLALLRLLKSKGEIWFDGQPLHTLNMRQMLPYRSRIQIVFQDPFSALNPRLTISQIIAEGLEVHQALSQEEREARVIKTMQEVGLDPETRHRYPTEFSGGQRQRISIARALILQPELLILDEPTSSLDRSVQAQILALLKNLQQQYQLTYLFISHDLQVIRALCHQIIVMRNGEIVEQGACETVFNAPQHAYTQNLLEDSR
ncbi:MAG: microcin C ABC transporter ATP-binding protein YejF [Enterobacteriaceae bacterium]|jgi:microcin C transport system ATP-binding protein|nr:microcin C ABC transporter ATP-binding protein YejF [Enterobacteriaceae bacterium]